jgi:anti-sigma factor RsiW
MAPLNDQEREDLVAYLDGELPEPLAKELEARLNIDAEARAEATALRKTWELLDFLPRPEPSAGFTNRTLEQISIQLPAALTAAARIRRWPGWAIGIGWAAAVLVAGSVGFAAVHHLGPGHDAGPKQLAPNPLAALKPGDLDNQLVQNLRILENWRLYENIDDFEFLRGLDDPDLFGEADGQP